MFHHANISRLEVFEGIIEATDWDDERNITGLVFNTTEREVLPIYMDLVAESLIDFCEERIKVRGTIFGGFLHITSFHLLRD